MIFNPLSPNKNLGDEQDTASTTTSNAFTTLQQDHIGNNYSYPINVDEIIKINPQQPYEFDSAKLDNPEVAEGSNKTLLSDPSKEN